MIHQKCRTFQHLLVLIQRKALIAKFNHSNTFSSSNPTFLINRHPQGKNTYYNNNNNTNRKRGSIVDENKLQSIVKKLAPDMEPHFDKFEDELIYRRKQAKNSILVKFDTDLSLPKINSLLNYLETDNAARVKGHYQLGKEFVLVELNTSKCVQAVLSLGSHFRNNDDHLQTRSRIFFFYPLVKSNAVNQQTAVKSSQTTTIKQFYDSNKIDEAGYRLRYFVASLIEESLVSLFNDCLCIPFGSTVNKFGHNQSDLDLTLNLENKNRLLMSKEKLQSNSSSGNFQSNRGVLLFNSKQVVSRNERTMSNFNLELIHFILTNILPRFKVKEMVKNARVPIIDFNFDVSPKPLNCDLSMSHSMVAFQMSKLFWIYSHLDSRVAPLVSFTRHWAKLNELTNPDKPNPFLTNFQLTYLVLSYLIRIERPLLVPLDELLSANFTDDGVRYIDNNISISRLKLKLQPNQNNKENLEMLFRDFLDYYANFDFNTYMVSLKAKLENKNRHSNKALFIVNPFEANINAAVNVDKRNLDRFVKCCNQSYLLIESIFNNKTNSFDVGEFLQLLKKNIKRKSADEILTDQMNY